MKEVTRQVYWERRSNAFKEINKIQFPEIPDILPDHQSYILKIPTPQARLHCYQCQLKKEYDIKLFLEIGIKEVSAALKNMYYRLLEDQALSGAFKDASDRLDRFERGQDHWIEETLLKPFAANSVSELSCKIGFWAEFIQTIIKLILTPALESHISLIVWFTESLYDANHSMLYTHDFERILPLWEADAHECKEKKRFLDYYLKYRTIAVDRMYDCQPVLMERIDEIHKHYGFGERYIGII